MKKIYFFICLCAISLSSYAQDITIKGNVADTSSESSLVNSTVVLLRAKDSILYKHTRSNQQGAFQFTNVDTGNYILMISYPNYADYTENFSLDGSIKEKDFGHFDLILKSELLKDVIVSSNVGAIRIKGDTTEFIADSFKVAANASIEDLLKRFPGFQVDKDGKITAQGETVQKVLVDGEEFFGDDPTLVTKNLRADMVDRVQLFDKKSDQATFSGIDDGVRDKTLNVKLKEDKKKGIFGKIEAGYGTEDMYQNQAMFNQFKNKRKLSAYATLANTGKTGLGFQDADKYGASNMEMTEDGGIFISDGGGDILDSWDGNYSGEGIPRVASGGIHYDNKWKEDKHYVNGNYKIGESALRGDRVSTTQTNLNEGTAQVESSNNSFDRYAFRQKADGFYEITFDTTFSIKASVSGSLGNSNSLETFNSVVKDQDSLDINNTNRTNRSTGENEGFSSNILFRKKLAKKGRTLSLNLSQNYRASTSEGLLNSTIEFNKLNRTQLLNQKRLNDNNSNNLGARVNYSEPLTEFTALGFNYQYFLNKSETERRTYNQDAGGDYSLLDNLYSNHFEFDQNTHRGGVSYNYNKNNKVFNIGSDVGVTDVTLTDVMRNTPINRKFTNLYPSAMLRMNLPKQFRLWTRYYGSTRQPSLTQLQPIFTTEDTMNIYIGNPELKAGYNHGINININKFDVLTSNYVGIYGYYGQTYNAVVTNVTTDILSGRRTYNYFNADQPNSNYHAELYFRSKIKKLDLEYGFGLRGNGNKYVNSVNNVLYTTKSNNYSLSNSLRKVKDKKYDISIGQSLGYNHITTSQEAASNNNGFNYYLNPSVEIFLPKGFQINTHMNYQWQQKTETFNTDFNRALWHAWIGKKFFKKENLLIKLSAFDILNQNKGFDRRAWDNIFYESYYTTIPRHFMLSVIWDFNKMGGTVKNNNNE